MSVTNDIAEHREWERAIRRRMFGIDPIEAVEETPRGVTPRESAAITAITCIALVLIVGSLLGWF